MQRKELQGLSTAWRWYIYTGGLCSSGAPIPFFLLCLGSTLKLDVISRWQTCLIVWRLQSTLSAPRTSIGARSSRKSLGNKTRVRFGRKTYCSCVQWCGSLGSLAVSWSKMCTRTTWKLLPATWAIPAHHNQTETAKGTRLECDRFSSSQGYYSGKWAIHVRLERTQTIFHYF